MDQVLKIFTQLGIDGTVFYQFAIFFALYFILKFILFNKLQYVMDLRKEKTVVLDHQANLKMAETDKILCEYEAKIDKAHHEAHLYYTDQKAKILKANHEQVQQKEEELNTETEKKAKEFEKELDNKKIEIMKNVNELSRELVNKFSS